MGRLVTEDPQALGRIAEGLFELGGRRGPPEAVQTLADAYPGATISHVVYDLGVALSLALLDLAEDVAATAEVVAGHMPPPECDSPGGLPLHGAG